MRAWRGLGVAGLVWVCVALGGRGAWGKGKKKAAPEEESTIEDVDEERIDEIVSAGEQHIVIVLYDRPSRCPMCEAALQELEEIDDDLEKAHIEVVKSDDKHLAQELGVHTLPALVYFRRKHPIFYDGEFGESTEVLKWVRAHGEVVAEELDDDNFEDETESANPDDEDLDWFVMFFNSKEEGCNSYIPVWETTAHKLRGQVVVGQVDIFESDDVADRFKVDDHDDCPTFLLFHRGKMYRYKDAARDTRSLTSFALHRYKEQRGHRVPDPPTLIEEVYEEVKEGIYNFFEDNFWSAIGGTFLILLVVGGGYLGLKRLRNRKASSGGEPVEEEVKDKDS